MYRVCLCKCCYECDMLSIKQTDVAAPDGKLMHYLLCSRAKGCERLAAYRKEEKEKLEDD